MVKIKKKKLDLKPENILIDEERKIYLCDFGMSKVLQDEKETCRVAGTTEYCSPEQIQFEPLSSASDMWSVGVIAYVLLSKISPFNPAQDGQEKHETQNAVINCTYDFDDSSWNSRSSEAKSFIQTLLIRAPQVSKDTKKKAREQKAISIFPSNKYFPLHLFVETRLDYRSSFSSLDR